MLQDVASHYISELECLKTLRTTALKSSSRNYPKESKYKFETKIHSCNVASPSVSCKTWNTLSRCINPPAGARVEMALAKKATLLQTTPRWNQQTLTSVVNSVVPWWAIRSFFDRSSGSIGSESFESSPPPPPRLSLPRTDTQQIGLNTAGCRPSPRAVIARSVCVPGWNGGEECGILQVSGCAELPVKLPSSERDSAKVPFCLLWVNRARETFIIDRVYRAIEWRLKFGNRSSSLGDLRGGGLCPPPAGRVTIQTPAGRGLMFHVKRGTGSVCDSSPHLRRT